MTSASELTKRMFSGLRSVWVNRLSCRTEHTQTHTTTRPVIFNQKHITCYCCMSLLHKPRITTECTDGWFYGI